MNPYFQQWIFSFTPFSSTLFVHDHSAFVRISAPSIFCQLVWLRSGHGPASPRDCSHQGTQCVTASCLNPVSIVTGLVMWQGRSVNAVDLLPIVGNRGNKRREGEEKTVHRKMEMPLHYTPVMMTCAHGMGIAKWLGNIILIYPHLSSRECSLLTSNWDSK